MSADLLTKNERTASPPLPDARFGDSSRTTEVGRPLRRQTEGLTFSHVTKRFGAVQALSGCSFSVARGRMVGFLGPNGAGKTTAMRAIFGLVRLDGGELLWDGQAVELAEGLRFGYMPEERGLYPRMPDVAAYDADAARAIRAPNGYLTTFVKGMLGFQSMYAPLTTPYHALAARRTKLGEKFMRVLWPPTASLDWPPQAALEQSRFDVITHLHIA